MNWFKRHLNLTWLLAYVFYMVGCFVSGMLLAILAFDTSDASMSVMVYVLGAIIMLPASLWVFTMKGRSLWWVLLAGWLSPLWLSNKRNREI